MFSLLHSWWHNLFGLILQVVRSNYSSEERKALVELVSYIKSIGSMMQRCETMVADALWETIHSEVQDFVQNRLATMLKTTFRKKKDLSRWGLFHYYVNFVYSS